MPSANASPLNLPRSIDVSPLNEMKSVAKVPVPVPGVAFVNKSTSSTLNPAVAALATLK